LKGLLSANKRKKLKMAKAEAAKTVKIYKNSDYYKELIRNIEVSKY
jgi:hypothetical protein